MSLLKRSLVCPDFLDQAVQEGECQQLQADEIGPDLISLLKNSDKYSTYRESTTVFDSTGWALEDFVAGQVLTEIAKETNCGTQIELACLADDPRNPYGFFDRESDQEILSTDEYSSPLPLVSTSL